MVRSMEELRGIVQQSVQMAAELQGSAESLYRQSDVLNGVVGRFHTGAKAGAMGQSVEHQPLTERRGEASAFISSAGSLSVQRVRAADPIH